MKIPLIKPKMPAFEKIASYLEESYKESYFTNNGPLLKKLTKEYSKITDNKNIVLTCNATIGMVVLLKSLNIVGKKIAVPSFTFPATALAVITAGFQPLLVDVDQESMSMDLKYLQKILDKDKEIGAIIPVFPLGFDINSQEYLQFSKKNNIQCVFDAAACLGMKKIDGNVVYSLHATKTNGIGEGGVVQSELALTKDKVDKSINFGLTDGLTTQWGINAKMSEFQAAVGLATMENFHESIYQKRFRFDRYINEIAYGKVIDRLNGYQVFPLIIEPIVKPRLIKYLSNLGIDTKTYYNSLHEQPFFSRFAEHDLSISSSISNSILCIPLYESMGYKEQTYIIESINSFS